jgi:3-phosphoshikimate 1-carboxyvinyltransferase
MSKGSSILVRPGEAPRGRAPVPGDKSVTHRALLLGALAEGETFAFAPNRGEDCLGTVRALRSLGVSIEEEGGGFRVRGKGGRLAEPKSVLDLGNSGTGARLLAGVLAAEPFASTIDGDDSLRRRPMGRVVLPLRAMGALIDGPDGGRRLPLTIRGGGLRGITHRTRVASAQTKSAVLLAGLRAGGSTTVIEPSLSRDHTERMIAYFGGRIDREGLAVTLAGGQPLRGARVEVGGDPSSAAFFLVAALLVPGGDVTAEGVLDNPTRTAFLDVLERMGARIERIPAETVGPEKRMHVRARYSELRGTEIGGAEVPRLLDEIPVLAAAAAACTGTFRVRDAAELRVKESDRIRLICEMLASFGLAPREQDDGFEVEGGRLRGGRVRSGGDHRIAMAAAVAALAAEGESLVEESACIATSFPEFLPIGAALGLGSSLREEIA